MDAETGTLFKGNISMRTRLYIFTCSSWSQLTRGRNEKRLVRGTGKSILSNIYRGPSIVIIIIGCTTQHWNDIIQGVYNSQLLTPWYHPMNLPSKQRRESGPGNNCHMRCFVFVQTDTIIDNYEKRGPSLTTDIITLLPSEVVFPTCARHFTSMCLWNKCWQCFIFFSWLLFIRIFKILLPGE